MMTVFLLPPESEQLEYKREFNSSGEKKRLLRTVVAFANGKGGKIIIGVDDASRTVSGLPPETDLSRLTDAVTNSIADNCTPQVAYKIRVEILDEKPVVVLDVFPGAFTPYYLKELGPDQGTFIRTGATTRLADIYRLMNCVSAAVVVLLILRSFQGHRPLHRRGLKPCVERFTPKPDKTPKL